MAIKIEIPGIFGKIENNGENLTLRTLFDIVKRGLEGNYTTALVYSGVIPSLRNSLKSFRLSFMRIDVDVSKIPI
ncbi:hypothetical protein EEL52_13770 [Muribaculaceae bacterium Isolate-113 (HZI)]|nr:hypothetical protein EEL53_14230 [Muribaculaceae bacterium Isolate-114 (HZI)]ROT18138.1 hypothetical protein EEL52_13770 [Muribaculaceae bacterium Isolate-113 (HZI)]